MDWLTNVYLVCAVVGGALLVVQTVLIAVGGGHDGHLDTGDVHSVDIVHEGDVTHPGDATFVKWLSLKAVVASLTFFGLGGLAATKAGLDTWLSLAIALAAGTASVFLVGLLMASLGRLQSAGNINLQNAVGRPAKVYLRIPASRGGHGKVTVEVQGRSVELEAVTPGVALATGADVRVTSVIGPGVVEVQPLSL
jgi:hypothetical protein